MTSTVAEFATEDDARAAIVDTCARMNALGINHGKAGNVSVRWHRGGADGCLITPSALAYERMRPDDIVWLPMAEPAGSAWLFEAAPPPAHPPSTEWRMHRVVYQRTDGLPAAAVVHTHSVFATTLACLPRVQREGIPPFHYMIAMAGGHDIRCAPYATFGTAELAGHIAGALRGRLACLIANHGVITSGRSLESALALAVEVETLARMYWQALQVEPPVRLSDEEMARVLEKFRGYGR